MSATTRIRSFLKAALQQRRLESEMEAEMRDHLERYTSDLMTQGLSPEEARRKARVEFGAVEARKEECREAVGLRWWNDFRADWGYALRMLQHSPGFTAVAVLSLALGIGANTAIFSLADTLFLRSLPVENPGALKILAWTSGPRAPMESIWGTCRGQTAQYCYSFSFPAFEELRRESSDLLPLFAFKGTGATASVNGRAETIKLNLVSGNYFSGLGLQPALGRGITDKDERGKEFVAVLSHGFWERRFGRNANIVGKQLSISDRVLTIVGVAPAGFAGLHPAESPDVFVPITLQAEMVPQPGPAPSILQNGEFWWVEAAGRLKPNVTEGAAQAHLNLTLQQIAKAQFGKKKRVDAISLRWEPGSNGYDELRFAFAPSLFVLLGVVSLVLLIACANLANLLLSRAAVRQREMGVRLALGASGGRLVRQGLTESFALASLGGALGLLLGVAGRNIIPHLLATPWQPNRLSAEFDYRVLAFTIAVTLATGLIFGLAPALRAAHVDINSNLKVSGRSQTHSRSSQLAGKAIVVFEVALSALLLVGAGLFLRTLVNLQAVRLGFNPQRLVLFTVDPPRNRYTGEKRIAFFQKLEEGIAALPTVESSTLTNIALISNSTSTTTITPPHTSNPIRVWLNHTGDQFFQTMQIPILQGRAFDTHDRQNSPRVVVINESLAKAFFGQSNPMGQTLGEGKNSRGTIIGICRDVKYKDLRQAPPPTAYFPYKQEREIGSLTVAVRTHAGPVSIVAAARQIVADLDKDVPILDVRTQTEQINASLKTERLFAALTAGVGLLAVLLACVGVYGVMAYTVTRRTNEIGIRMALGAVSGEVLRMILRETALLATAGIAAGVALSVGMTRLVASMLYGLGPNDPITLTSTLVLMLVVTLLAGWIPARRASRVDPMVALRQE